MGRALFAVGALLALLLRILGVVVYFTRSEDQLAIDNQLAENVTRAISQSEELGRDVDLRRLAPFPWSRVLVVAPDTTASAVSRELGSEYKADLPLPSASTVFVFANGNALARGGRLPRPRDVRGLRRADRLAAAARGGVPRARLVVTPLRAARLAPTAGCGRLARDPLRLRLRARLGLRLAARACAAPRRAAGRGGARRGGHVGAGVARDEPADPDEQEQQRAADREQQPAIGVLLGRGRLVGSGVGVGSGVRGLRQGAERAAPGRVGVGVGSCASARPGREREEGGR